MTPTTPEEARRIIAEYHLYANDARRRTLGRILDRPDALADALRSLAAQLEAAQEQIREAQEMAWEACGEREAAQEQNRQLAAVAVEFEQREKAAQEVIETLKKARPYVVEHGPPGTGIETTDESAERSAALLAEIDDALARYDAAIGEK